MIIKDDFIFCEKNDFKEKFRYLVNNKVDFPPQIEEVILRAVLDDLNISINENKTSIDELFNKIPKNIINNVIDTVDNLYMNLDKVYYSDKIIPYTLYYLPTNVLKIHKLLGDLFLKNLLKKEIKLIDIASGPGSMSIGIIMFYNIIARNMPAEEFKIDITLLDVEQRFLDLATKLIENIWTKTQKNLKISITDTIHKEIDGSLNLNGNYDIISMGNLLNEFSKNEQSSINNLFENIFEILKNNGSVLIIEPGDEARCVNFKEIRNLVINNTSFNIFSPCNDVWGTKKEYNCKCHSSGVVNWSKPRIIRKLNHLGLRKQVNSVSYNYLILRKDGKIKYELDNNFIEFTKLGEIDDSYNGKSVSIKGIVRYIVNNSGVILVNICDGTKELNANMYMSICLKKSLKIYNQNKIKIDSINLGQMIVGENLICETMKKYKNSYLFNVNDDSKIEIRY